MGIQTKTMVVKSDTAFAETKTTIRDTVTFDTSKLPNGITYKGLKAVLSFAEPIQWNKASTYDALTVVWDDATHASYASKRRVPQNIELKNEFYWLRTADLDAQVEMYRQEVQEFDGRIKANAQAIAAETARAENAERKETARAESAEQKITSELNFEISKTMNRKILWIGDSFSSDYHSDKNGDWSPVGVLQRIYKMNIVNMAVDGAGFAKGKTFLEQAQSATDKESYTDIVVYGGDNDLYASSMDSVIDAIKKFWPYCISNFPKANLWLFACNTPIKSNFQLTYNYLYYTQSRSPRIKVFTNVNAVMLATNTTQSTTNEHPTKLGGEFLANYFYKALNGSTPTLTQNHKGSKLSESFTVNDNRTYVCVANLSGIYFQPITITLTSDITDTTPLFKVPIWLSPDNNGYSRYLYTIDGIKNHNVGFEIKSEDTTIWDGTSGKKGYMRVTLFGNFNSGDVVTIPGITIPFTGESII